MKAAVFSGTSEGREISEYLNSKKIITKVFVATDYGKDVMEDMEYVSVNVGRLDKKEMKRVIFDSDFVIDATHPFAKTVTENIVFACNDMGVKYIRLLRDESFVYKNGVISVKSVDEAVDVLKNTHGNIFVSTGSKELHKYIGINDYKKRITARVLPVLQSKEKCEKIGLENVIYKKGPFSYSENICDFKKYDIKWLVTKNSGEKGGFYEKINSAKALGINIIIIERPYEKGGFYMEEVKKIINEQYKL